jgi:pyrimidine-specific ribonucleoside hydrolase
MYGMIFGKEIFVDGFRHPHIPLILDMETADPDDILCLAILVTHPACDLKAITLHPGSHEQVGLVTSILQIVGRDREIPIGGKVNGHLKSCVSPFYDKFHPWPVQPKIEADDLLIKTIKENPDITLVTGAALTNIWKAMKKEETLSLKRWVGQGGFAGDNIVPEEKRLEKFRGKTHCPTYNFNGNPVAAKYLLESDRIERKILVSKNVCHGVVYDKEFQEKLTPFIQRYVGLIFIHQDIMDDYLKKHEGKKFHDPLAGLVAIDESICEFEKNVVLERVQGGWGCKKVEKSDIQISIDVDRKKMFDTLIAQRFFL